LTRKGPTPPQNRRRRNFKPPSPRDQVALFLALGGGSGEAISAGEITARNSGALRL
jgi:hypothetical protein